LTPKSKVETETLPCLLGKKQKGGVNYWKKTAFNILLLLDSK